MTTLFCMVHPPSQTFTTHWDDDQVRTKVIKARIESGESVKIYLFCNNAVDFKEIKFKWLHSFVCLFSLSGVHKNDQKGSEK